MPPISITLGVLKLLKSRCERLEQPENILFILATFDVLKLLRIRLVRPKQ